MRIETQQQGAVTVIQPHGPLSRESVDAFRTKLNEVSTQSLGRYVIDMSAISFIDSCGLEALLDTSEHLDRSGRILKLCSANETLLEVFDLTELSSHFEHYEETTTAVRSFL